MTANQLIQKLEAAGWQHVRTNGSLKMFTNPSNPKTLSVPDPGKKDLGKGLVNTILKDAGLKK